MMRLLLALLGSLPMIAGAAPPADVPQTVPAATPPPPAPPADALDLGTDQPGRMTVPVTIGGSGPFPFTIDTGAERTVISRELASRLGLARGSDVNLTAMTGSSNVGTVVIPAIAVSTAAASQIEAPLLSAANLGAPGLLGIDTLKDHAVIIDFDARRMTVVPSTHRPRRRASSDEIVVRAKSMLGQLIVTDAFFRDQRVRVVLDTGSVVTMGNAALRARARRVERSAQPISLISVTGAVLTADYAQIGDVQIGGVIFRDLPVAFADAPPFTKFGLDDQPALLLGMDALKQFRRVEIDFANREVRFALPKSAIASATRGCATGSICL